MLQKEEIPPSSETVSAGRDRERENAWTCFESIFLESSWRSFSVVFRPKSEPIRRGSESSLRKEFVSSPSSLILRSIASLNIDSVKEGSHISGGSLTVLSRREERSSSPFLEVKRRDSTMFVSKTFPTGLLTSQSKILVSWRLLTSHCKIFDDLLSAHQTRVPSVTMIRTCVLCVWYTAISSWMTKVLVSTITILLPHPTHSSLLLNTRTIHLVGIPDWPRLTTYNKWTQLCITKE